MLNAKISGIASYLPDDVLDNEMLSKMVDTNDEWITTRVGIKERRILKKDAGSSYLGIQAVNKLLADTGIAPEEVELLICATSNPDYRFPSTGSIICEGCGLKNAYAYDIQAACAGFIVALEDAAAYVKSGLRKKVIVVAAEKMSSMINYNDRSTCPLFHVDGRGLEHLVMWGGGSARPATADTLAAGDHYLFQDGRNVYKNAVTDMYTASVDILNRNNLTAETIDWLVPHQANLRIIEAVSSRAGIPDEKVLVNIQHTGNTSAASIPLCLDEFKGKIKKGDKILLTAFGAGFTWGSMLVVWDI